MFIGRNTVNIHEVVLLWLSMLELIGVVCALFQEISFLRSVDSVENVAHFGWFGPGQRRGRSLRLRLLCKDVLELTGTALGEVLNWHNAILEFGSC